MKSEFDLNLAFEEIKKLIHFKEGNVIYEDALIAFIHLVRLEIRLRHDSDKDK